MAHMVESMAYSGEVPWHGLGKEVGPDLTPSQIAAEAGIDWEVYKAPLTAAGLRGPVAVEKSFALTRASDDKVLSIVGPDYVPVQNLDAVDFFKKFTEAGAMKMDTAGSLRGGELIWALASVQYDFALAADPDDVVKGYILLSNPHRQGVSMRIMQTPIRVVCNNTYTQALGLQTERLFRFTHDRAFDHAMKAEAERALGLARDQMEVFEEQANLLASRRADKSDLLEYIYEVMDPASLEKSTKIEKASRRARMVFDALDAQPGSELDSSKGTWWGAFNAVTYVIDHKLGRTRDGRLNNAWFGAAANTKRHALDAAVSRATKSPTALAA